MNKSTLEMARNLVARLEAEEKEEKVQLKDLKPGETFMIGEHEFIVLEQVFEVNGGDSDVTGVVSKNFMLKSVAFDSRERNYRASVLRDKIEEKILPIIEKEVGSENIVENICYLRSVCGDNKFGMFTSKVRPMTFDEARKYHEFIPNEDLDDWWWTCTPWGSDKNGNARTIATVSPSGHIGCISCNRDNGVRPFCILKSDIFVSKGELL